MAALAEWDALFAECRDEWNSIEPHVRREMAPIAAHAAWQLGDWVAMQRYVEVVASHGQHAGGAEGAFLSAVISIKNQAYEAAAGGRAGRRAGGRGTGAWLGGGGTGGFLVIAGRWGDGGMGCTTDRELGLGASHSGLHSPGPEAATASCCCSPRGCCPAPPALPCRPAPAVHVERARELLGTDLAALVGESYERAYADMLRVQQLTELEEILAVKLQEVQEEEAAAGGVGAAAAALVGSAKYLPLLPAAHGKQLMQSMWNGRLKGVQRNMEVWQALLRWVQRAGRWGVGPSEKA